MSERTQIQIRISTETGTVIHTNTIHTHAYWRWGLSLKVRAQVEGEVSDWMWWGRLTIRWYIIRNMTILWSQVNNYQMKTITPFLNSAVAAEFNFFSQIFGSEAQKRLIFLSFWLENIIVHVLCTCVQCDKTNISWQKKSKIFQQQLYKHVKTMFTFHFFN